MHALPPTLYQRLENEANKHNLSVDAFVEQMLERHQAQEKNQAWLEETAQREREWSDTLQRMMQALSHDLRIPLAVISTSTGILYRHYERLSPDERQQKMRTIVGQIRRMTHMIEDAGLAVRGSLSQLTFHPRTVNLVQLCENSVRDIQEMLDTSHKLVFLAEDDLGLAFLDEMLISRVIINLLSNAVKYSPDGGEIRLTLSTENGDIVLRVSDNGIGISPTDLPHVFEPLYRANNAVGIGGTGLGLSIVRDCVALHRGRVEVESALGKGTTFTVRLPFVVPKPRQARV
jgi:signal transduction histidine kinase